MITFQFYRFLLKIFKSSNSRFNIDIQKEKFIRKCVNKHWMALIICYNYSNLQEQSYFIKHYDKIMTPSEYLIEKKREKKII
jgi:hypothetical protein